MRGSHGATTERLEHPASSGRMEVVAMFARLSTYQGAPVPAGAQPSQNAVQILEQIRKVPGFQGLYLLVDPSTGKSMSLTLWEDEQTMGASETEGTRIREESAKREGERIVSVERFEVGFQHLES